MVPGPFRLLLGVAVFTAAAAIVVTVAFVLLTSEDLGPKNACRDPLTGEERAVSRDDTYAETFQQTWNSVATQIEVGATEVTLGFSESEVTSRAAAYLDERDAPVNNLVICFHEGFAEARADVEVPGASGLPVIGGLFDTAARVTGTLDLAGEHPRLVITDLDAGDLPGFVEDELRADVEREINDRLTGLTIRYNYTSLVFTEGAATITATAFVP